MLLLFYSAKTDKINNTQVCTNGVTGKSYGRR
jgi:hypothetical protein